VFTASQRGIIKLIGVWEWLLVGMVITNDHAVDERAFLAVVMDDSTPL